ncbi:winged helix DNA-binding protein [Erythrobacter rubeus]|uniref:Winged helix DNA-binding protein n=1 Tax=Erythrobacter rubeus TaxID=2760803 RepID=A0ABR8KWM5_9SPHN|nr:winged helix DNA-binding protein [Erythrobacter rubeus]MBD2842622.1 winged helix DNA-binding protein [Erythrobacter rubeus]
MQQLPSQLKFLRLKRCDFADVITADLAALRMEMRPASRYMTRRSTGAALTRTELAIIRSAQAFERWCVVLHSTVSDSRLSAQDVWILHSIRMRGGAQNLSELLLFLNRNDVSTIQYSLRKIEQAGLIERVTGNSKREAGYRLTEEGEAATKEYADLRDELLIELAEDIRDFEEALVAAASTLERLTGTYDQATQLVLNRKIMQPPQD